MSNETTPQDESLLTFPCDFTLKVFGHASEAFETAVIEIVQKHIPDFSKKDMVDRQSKEGKYSALSVTVHVNSRAQLDDLYRDLSASSQVLMVLY